MEVKRSELVKVFFQALFTLVLFLICLWVFFSPQIDVTDLTNSARASLYDEDGTLTRSQVGVDDWILGMGETLVIHLPLPEHPRFSGADSLVMNVHNASVEIVWNGKILASQGEEEAYAHKTIGNMLVRCRIPDAAWGSTLEISMRSYALGTDEFGTPIRIMPTREVHLYPLIGHPEMILLFFIISAVSALSLIYQTLTALIRRDGSQATTIWMNDFILLLSIWYLGYNRAYYVFGLKRTLCEDIEYIALYFVWIPMMTYLLMKTKVRWFRSFCQTMMLVFSVNMVFSFALAISDIRLDLADMLHPFQVILFFTLVVTLVNALCHRMDSSQEERLAIGSFAILIFFGIISILAIQVQIISGLPGWMTILSKIDFPGIGLTIYILFVGTYFLLRRNQELRMRIQHQELVRLAYLDPLTRTPNRAAVTKKIEEGVCENPEAVVFMDIDHLKRANDWYGHEMGDKLICAVADRIRDAFHQTAGSRDFYGRWGGDEFVASFMRKKDAERFERILTASIGEVDASGCFPFPVSVSIGVEEGKTSGMGPLERIAEADRVMYREKKCHHEQRT